MQFDKFGSTLIFIVGIVFVLIAAKMVIRVADPYTRKVSASLADTLATI